MTRSPDRRRASPFAALLPNSRASRTNGDALASIQTSFDLGEDLALRSIAEIAYLGNEGVHKADALSATVGAEIQKGQWFGSLLAAVHDLFGSSNPSNYMLTASIGREFETATTGAFRIDAGYS